MQFIVIAHDGKDSEALSRRMAVRPAHLALSDETMKRGELLYAAAILNDSEQMCGSVMIAEFETHEKLDAWLKIEPYVMGKVWQEINILPCKVGPSFAKKPAKQNVRLWIRSKKNQKKFKPY